jgi:hypothetical protein
MKEYLNKTVILDFESDLIQSLVNKMEWHDLEDSKKIERIYNYVRDEIKFGYNIDDNIPASIVLKDGYGQCNTKANLFMALLRAVGIPNRIHGFTINKALQKGAISGIWYALSPKNILHSWVEVYLYGNWYNLEGIILDRQYLSALQKKFSDYKTTFCGYGVYTYNFANPQIDWDLKHTYIQNLGINQDFGLFESPDKFYSMYQQKLNYFEKWIYRNYVRHAMNRNINEIRKSHSEGDK